MTPFIATDRAVSGAFSPRGLERSSPVAVAVDVVFVAVADVAGSLVEACI